MMNPIRVEKLSKTFFDEGRGEVHAVRDVSFECRAGEIFGLLGANGAGKTTTLRILATILKPSAGTASVMGHDVLSEPEAGTPAAWLQFFHDGVVSSPARSC